VERGKLMPVPGLTILILNTVHNTQKGRDSWREKNFLLNRPRNSHRSLKGGKGRPCHRQGIVSCVLPGKGEKTKKGFTPTPIGWRGEARLLSEEKFVKVFLRKKEGGLSLSHWSEGGGRGFPLGKFCKKMYFAKGAQVIKA